MRRPWTGSGRASTAASACPNAQPIGCSERRWTLRVAASTPRGRARGRAGLLTGCVQRLFFADVNARTARLLSAAGWDVVVPRAQGCCGALHLHAGRLDEFRGFASSLMASFPANVDVIVTNAAGCGSALKEYGHWLPGEGGEGFAAKARDITEVLVDSELPLGEGRATVA